MTSRLRVVAVLVVAVLGGALPARADTRDPLAAGVWLDAAAPTDGAAVTGVRSVAGTAQAPEGVLSVALYVLPAGRALDLATDQPFATTYPLLPVGEIVFAFDWDTAAAPAPTVDLHVVAVTLLRDLGAAVAGVRVLRPAATDQDRALGPRARPYATPPPRMAAAVADRRRESSRLGVYVGGFSETLPYRRTPSAAMRMSAVVAARPAAASSDVTRGPWLSVALGLMLLVGAAHVHRLLRPEEAQR